MDPEKRFAAFVEEQNFLLGEGKEYFHHFGMFNVNRRIVQAFGQRYGIKIESEVGEHTTIDIVVPYSQSKSQEELNV